MKDDLPPWPYGQQVENEQVVKLQRERKQLRAEIERLNAEIARLGPARSTTSGCDDIGASSDPERDRN